MAYCDDETAEETATGTVKALAGVLFILGLCTIPTPLASIALVLCPIGGIIWMCSPAMKKAEDDMLDIAGEEGYSVRSGCALAWVWLVGLTVFALAGLVAFAAVAGGMR